MTLPDKDSLATYGGAMANYADPVDPTTDEDAAWRNKYAANVAMMTHTITRGFRRLVGTTGGATGSTPFDPSSGTVHDALWGDGSSAKPSATYVQTGIIDVIWPTTVTDELGATHTLTIRDAWAKVDQGDTTLRIANAEVTGSQKVRVYLYQGTSLSQLVGKTITVFIV